MVSLCSKEDIEALVQATFSSSTNPTDSQVSDWILQSSEFIEQLTGHKYEEKTATDEYHDGNGTVFFMLDHYPITSVTTLTVDGSSLTLNTDYWIKDANAGVIECLTAPLGRLEGDAQGHRSIKCTYKYGTTSIPAAVKELCQHVVAIKALNASGLTNTSSGAVKSYDDGDLSITYQDGDKLAASLLARYNELKAGVPRKLGAASGGLP